MVVEHHTRHDWLQPRCVGGAHGGWIGIIMSWRCLASSPAALRAAHQLGPPNAAPSAPSMELLLLRT